MFKVTKLGIAGCVHIQYLFYRTQCPVCYKVLSGRYSTNERIDIVPTMGPIRALCHVHKYTRGLLAEDTNGITYDAARAVYLLDVDTMRIKHVLRLLRSTPLDMEGVEGRMRASW